MNILTSWRSNNTISLFIILFFFSACENIDRKKKMESSLDIVYVDSSQQIVDANELASLFSKDRLAYEKTYKDSTIFIMGSIQRIDKEHGEVLLRNEHDKAVVCVVKNDSTLQFLSGSDRVLFKGICRANPGYGVVLIGQCEVAQIKK